MVEVKENRASLSLVGKKGYNVCSITVAWWYIRATPNNVVVMSEVPQSAQMFRFGIFEVDTVCGELRKHGSRIRLQEQPFQILVSLLDHAGELVSREELCHKVWAPDTFVDFEQGLGTAIKKLRQSLGDDADAPRYIETCPNAVVQRKLKKLADDI